MKKPTNAGTNLGLKQLKGAATCSVLGVFSRRINRRATLQEAKGEGARLKLITP